MFEDFLSYDEAEPAGLELPKISFEGETSKEALRRLCREGIKSKGIDKFSNKKVYYDRAKREIEIFEELGFTDYILLNWDIISFARRENIPVGDGRGSGAGSLVLYLLGVVNIDPIKHNLYFERFVSKNRAKKVYDKYGREFLDGSLIPDVDTDIAHSYRDKVLSYIESRFKGKTAKIATFNSFSSKLCIKECAKYFLEVGEEEANKISDMIPKEHGINFSLERSLEESPTFSEWVEKNRNVFISAKKVEGLIKNEGVHPSGIAICAHPIEEVMPLHLAGGEPVCSYEMGDVSDLAVKFDILGLRTLSIAYKTCEKVGVDFSSINPEDDLIYVALQDFKFPAGLFQISAPTNYGVVKKIRPLNLQELSDCVALARPAALQFVNQYVAQKDNLEPLGLNKNLDEILKTSKNVLLYQEQMMRICHEVFGLSLDEAESLRRAIGKKKVEEIPKWEKIIFDAAKENGVSVEAAKYFWDVVERSAAYQFNLSHSIAYASLSAKTVWLKTKYPKEFFCSILEIAEDDPSPLDVVAEITREMQKSGFSLLPPRLDKSKIDFTIEGNGIRYGLKSIKGVAEESRAAIMEFAKYAPKNKYEVFQLAKEQKINIGLLTSMILAGVLGDKNRMRIALEAQAFNILTPREQRNFAALGNEDLLQEIADSVSQGRIGDDNKKVMSPQRFETFKRNFAPYKKMYLENNTRQKLAVWWFEKKILGYSYSNKLSECFSGVTSLACLGDRSWRVIGHVDSFFVRTSANGNRYMKLTISDESDSKDVIFADSPNKSSLTNWLAENKLEEDDIVTITGGSSGDSHFANEMKIFPSQIYTKIRELK